MNRLNIYFSGNAGEKTPALLYIKRVCQRGMNFSQEGMILQI